MADTHRSSGAHRAAEYEEAARRDRVRGSPPRDGPTRHAREEPEQPARAPRTTVSGPGRRRRRPPVNAEQQRILDWVQTVRFKHVLFGGVREQDVWAKLEELERLYDASIRAERARYDALLALERDNGDELP